MLTAEVEPNDTLAAATPFLVGDVPLMGRITNLGDKDYYSIQLTQGQTLWANYNTQNTFPKAVSVGLELLDANGNVMARKVGGEEAQFVAPATGTYYVRATAANELGGYTEQYALHVRVETPTSFTPEVEPNNTSLTATPISVFSELRGALSSSADHDFYAFDVTAGGVAAIKFANVPALNPGLVLRDPTGAIVATDDAGLGLHYAFNLNGKYTLEVHPNRPSGPVVGGYLGALHLETAPAGSAIFPNGFQDATPVELGKFTVYASGTLNSLNESRYFSFDVRELDMYGMSIFRLGYGRQMTLYNDLGQRLGSGVGNGVNTMGGSLAMAPGRYYVGVQATAETGLGPFMMSFSPFAAYGDQRDVPLFFLDFTGQASHLNYPWVSPYAVPAAKPFIQGQFQSRFSAYDVDLTLSKPTAEEYVGLGYGNFGSIGAGGFGNGSFGERRPEGDALVSATESTWTALDYGATAAMNHEYGHGVGLDHARNPLNVMGYDTQLDQFPVGAEFTFDGADGFMPENYLANPRDYLDWALQSGRQLPEVEPNNSPATALNLAPYLKEIQFGLTAAAPISAGAGTGPSEIRTADFNTDGKPDLVVANYTSDTLSIYLNNGVGGFQAPVNYATGGAFADSDHPLVVGDLNGDGRPDVVVLNGATNSAAIFLTNADGTLATRQMIASVSPGPRTGAFADFNKDGKLDLVIGTYNSRFDILLGNGNGTFQPHATTFTPSATSTIVTGDVNADGNVDLVMTYYSTDQVAIFYGRGDGGFQTPEFLPTEDGPSSVALWDNNHDGTLDITVGTTRTNALMTFDNFGFFADPTTYYFGQYSVPDVIVIADFTGDGLDDLITYSNNSLLGFMGRPQGGYGEPLPLPAGFSAYTAAVADFNLDGKADIIAPRRFSNDLAVLLGGANDPRDDRTVVYGSISARGDADYYSFVASAGQTLWFDVDAAEFQRPLDAWLTIYDGAGNVVASNNDALDRDSGLASLDPYVVQTFATAGTYTARITGYHDTVGSYRFKMTTAEALEKQAPRVIATTPQPETALPSTRQFVIFLNDQLDPATLTAANVVVSGNTSGVRAGSVVFDPLQTALIWTATGVMPVDTYTVLLKSGSTGVRDLHGNALDGENDGRLTFPEVSGDGIAGGDFSFRFTISGANTSPAAVSSVGYRQHPYNRGLFTVNFTDDVSFTQASASSLRLRAAGADETYNTADDRLLPVDPVMDYLNPRQLMLFTRGVPDLGRYRVEGQLVDAAGNTVTLNHEGLVSAEVPATAFFLDAALTQPGLTGSYVNDSLRAVVAQNDWRVTQPISGTRTDAKIQFTGGDWGKGAEVGVTSASEADWPEFSVQWDGYIRIPTDGTRLLRSSDDGSRMWIDINGDGLFAASGSEYLSASWGSAVTVPSVESSVLLAAGTYKIRIQYESEASTDRITLDWIAPNYAPTTDGIAHGPSVVDVSIQPSTAVTSSAPVAVTFSGAIDPATLNTFSFSILYSADANFLDGNNTFVTEMNSTIAWDATTNTATFEPSSPLAPGNYRILLRSGTTGIKNTAGYTLDGEFLDTNIASGGATIWNWRDAPSGDGLPGGDYVATFTVARAPVVEGIAIDSGPSVTDGITNNQTLMVLGSAPAFTNVDLWLEGVGKVGAYFTTDSGTWNIVCSETLAPGTYRFYAVAKIDGADVPSNTFTVTVDVTAPAAPIITTLFDDLGRSTTDRITSDRTIQLRGGAEPFSTVVVRNEQSFATIVTQADAAGLWAADNSAVSLSDGTYTFTATATDLAGNVSATSATFTVTIDNQTPDPPVFAAISNDSGASNTDRITNDRTLIFSGTAEPSALVQVTRVGTGVIGTVTANGAGNWTFDYTATSLSDGVYSFTATATDLVNLVSGPSSTFVVTVDTVAPSIPTITFSDDTGTSGTDRLTNDTTLVLSGTTSPGLTVNVSGGLVGSTVANASGQWTLDMSATPLVDGFYSISAAAVDAAGNSSVTATLSITIDTQPPGGLRSQEGEPNNTFPSSDVLTYSFQPVAAGTRYVQRIVGSVNPGGNQDLFRLGPLDAGDVLTIGLDDPNAIDRALLGSAAVEIIREAGGAFTTVALSEEAVITALTLTVSDTYYLRVRSDVSAPTLTFLYEAAIYLENVGNAPGTGTNLRFEVEPNDTFATAQNVAGTWRAITHTTTIVGSITPGDIDFYEVGLNANDLVIAKLKSTSSLDTRLAIQLPPQTVVTVPDNMPPGNDSMIYAWESINTMNHYFVVDGRTPLTSGSYELTIERVAVTAPIVIGAPTMVAASDSGSSATDAVSLDNTPTITGRSAPNTSVQVHVDGALAQTVTSDSTGTWQVTLNVLPDGQHTVRSRSSDTAGNVTDFTPTLSMRIDTSLPTLSAIAPQTTNEDVARSVGLVIGDTNPLSELTVTTFSNDTLLFPAANMTVTGSGASRTLQLTPALNRSGFATITVVVTDLAGNTASRQFVATVNPVNDVPTLAVAPDSIPENFAGAVVAHLTITDADIGDSYTLSVDDPRFSAGGDTVFLKPGISLDYDTEPTVTLIATVTDAAGLSTSKTFIVNVTNVNEAPTALALSHNVVAENTGNVLIGTLTSTDPDANETFTYALDDNARFKIVGNQLWVNDNAAFDYETQPTFPVRVYTRDSSFATFGQTFVLTITNVNEAPSAINRNVNPVNENVAGAVVGTVAVLDPDVGDTHTWTVSDARFEVVTGQLRLKAAQSLDYESGASVSLNVTATDAGGLSVSTGPFSVAVVNVNEAPYDLSLSANTVAENAVGAFVGALQVFDPDGSGNFVFSVSNSHFEVASGALRVRSGESLDFEAGATQEVTILVRDDGGLQYAETFTVDVTNVNEAPTALTLVATPIIENVLGATVGPLAVVDQDVGDTHTYTVLDSRFEVIGGNLKLKPAAALNYEQGATVTVIVQVKDAGGLQRLEPFVLAVLNVNEAPTGLTLAAGSVPENAVGAIVGNLTVQDPDFGDSHLFAVSDARFEVSAGKLQLKPDQSLDYETAALVGVTVTATDSGGLPFSKTFNVVVTNVNEGPTALTLTGGTFAENVPGAVIGTFAIQDPDAGETYTWSVNDPRFEVDVETLQLTPALSIDFEREPTIQITVTATDSGGLSQQREFTLVVTDVNEAPTAINVPSLTVFENDAGARFGAITVSDPDAGDTAVWTISDNRFEIVGGMLQLRADQALDFEAANSIGLTITATDKGALSFARTVTVTVANVGERPTAILLSSLTVAENAPGAVIGSLSALDPDGSADHQIFTVFDARFEVVASQLVQRLQLTQGQLLDYETTPTTQILVRVTDNDGLTRDELFTLQVIDVNEPPELSFGAVSAVPENAPGAKVVDVAVFDPDAASFASLTVSDARFEIVGSELRVKAGAGLDFEVTPSITLQVIATDNGSPALVTSRPITVQVGNVNEAPTAVRLSRVGAFADTAGAWIGDVRVDDPERNVASITTSDPRFIVVDGALFLSPGAALAATETSVSLALTATDESGLKATRTFDLPIVARPDGWTHALQWRLNRYDVNADGHVTPLDALLVINDLNAAGIRALPKSEPGTARPGFVDVSGDDLLSAIDALSVINFLNAGGQSEGEEPLEPRGQTNRDYQQELLWLYAFQQLEEEDEA